MAYYEMFPEYIIELQREVFQHPDLLAILNNTCSMQSDMEEKLGHIAAYCNIVLDDTYDADDIEMLCEMLIQELKKKRGPILLS